MAFIILWWIREHAVRQSGLCVTGRFVLLLWSLHGASASDWQLLAVGWVTSHAWITAGSNSPPHVSSHRTDIGEIRYKRSHIMPIRNYEFRDILCREPWMKLMYVCAVTPDDNPAVKNASVNSVPFKEPLLLLQDCRCHLMCQNPESSLWLRHGSVVLHISDTPMSCFIHTYVCYPTLCLLM